MQKVENTMLVRHLGEMSEPYHARLLELREIVAGWLTYIPATFPHYTQHGVRHADEIVRQLSQLLFGEGSGEPTVPFSAVELYVLATAAYLHDTGLVASDAQKAAILASEEWTEWVAGADTIAARLDQIEALRLSSEPPNSEVANFLADVQLRYLLSDFIRHRHHFSSAQFVVSNQRELAGFGFDDPVLIGTIAALCEGHGLDRQDLEDRDRYPHRRTIRGEVANVRFLALLLRLGDLLDMSIDRACPLLQVAACPLPVDSLAHWSQYQRITHRLIAPDRLEIRAECETQDEHRYLADWCEWLADEVRNADIAMARTERHSDWSAPRMALAGPDATIEIKPSPSAGYIPSKWRLELDEAFVFQRLIRDAYSNQSTFIRELIQNAADATRCRALERADREQLASPTALPKELRAQYPIEISTRTERVYNQLSQCEEDHMVLAIEDHGIGMDIATIERFFLQVGRSMYRSREFTDRYGFVPSSKFGIGFLSVFAVSDHVTVETRHHQENSKSLRMVLTGPRSYLLTEAGTRTEPGTRIEVRLREPIDGRTIRTYVSAWCRRLEFPVNLSLDGDAYVIEAETASDFVSESPDAARDGGQIAVQAFPVERPGLEGELYVINRIAPDGTESWADGKWCQNTYPKDYPGAIAPMLPGSVTCVAGISSRQPFGHSETRAARIDIRRPLRELSLSREFVGEAETDPLGSELRSRWAELLRDHVAKTPLAQGDEAWKYKHRLMDEFRIGDIWLHEPDTVPVLLEGNSTLVSIETLVRAETVVTAILAGNNPLESYGRIGRESLESEGTSPARDIDAFCLEASTRQHISDFALGAIFKGRAVQRLQKLDSGHIMILWGRDSDLEDALFQALPLNDEKTVGFTLHATGQYGSTPCLVNANHPLVQWVVRVGEFAGREAHDVGISADTAGALKAKLRSAVEHPGVYLGRLVKFVASWDEQLPGLPVELAAPRNLQLTADAFLPAT